MPRTAPFTFVVCIGALFCLELIASYGLHESISCGERSSPVAAIMSRLELHAKELESTRFTATREYTGENPFADLYVPLSSDGSWFLMASVVRPSPESYAWVTNVSDSKATLWSQLTLEERRELVKHLEQLFRKVKYLPFFDGGGYAKQLRDLMNEKKGAGQRERSRSVNQLGDRRREEQEQKARASIEQIYGESEKRFGISPILFMRHIQRGSIDELHIIHGLHGFGALLLQLGCPSKYVRFPIGKAPEDSMHIWGEVNVYDEVRPWWEWIEFDVSPMGENSNRDRCSFFPNVTYVGTATSVGKIDGTGLGE